MSILNIRHILQKVVGSTAQPLTLGGIQTDGSDAPLKITDGAVQIGNYATTTDVQITGYITIKDIDGYVRKLATID